MELGKSGKLGKGGKLGGVEWNAIMNESKTRLNAAVCCRQKEKIDGLKLIAVETGSMSILLKV